MTKMTPLEKDLEVAKDREKVTIDLSDMDRVRGRRYEDTYGSYMNIFHKIAKIEEYKNVIVIRPPASWVGILDFLNCHFTSYQIYFEEDRIAEPLASYLVNYGRSYKSKISDLAHWYNCHTNYRPETADAYWKLLNQSDWTSPRISEFQYRDNFVVTDNGSFYRPEIQDYLDQLKSYQKPDGLRNLVIVPCAADKPYPAPLHSEVRNIIDEVFGEDNDWYIGNATGVLGFVPEMLWATMPHYDSGVPNEWRLCKYLANYLKRNEHDHIVVYADYYNEAIWTAYLKTFEQSLLEDIPYIHFINPIRFYYDYLDLLDQNRLDNLRSKLTEIRGI